MDGYDYIELAEKIYGSEAERKLMDDWFDYEHKIIERTDNPFTREITTLDNPF